MGSQLLVNPATSSYKPSSYVSPQSSRWSGLMASYGSYCDGIKQIACAARGHYAQLIIERDRLSIRCAACAYESSGLDLHTRWIRWAWMLDKRKKRQGYLYDRRSAQ